MEKEIVQPVGPPEVGQDHEHCPGHEDKGCKRCDTRDRLQFFCPEEINCGRDDETAGGRTHIERPHCYIEPPGKRVPHMGEDEPPGKLYHPGYNTDPGEGGKD